MVTFHISTFEPHRCLATRVSEYRRRGLWGCCHPGLHSRRARRPGTLLATFPLQTGSSSPRTSRSGAPSPARRHEGRRRASRSHPSPLSPLLFPGLQAGAAPRLAGLQLRTERSRLGSSSSMALLPHYPDVGPSPPRLYRLSAVSARVMRALLITIAQTPLTLTAPSEERQHLLCAGRRPSPASRPPSLAAPLFLGPLPRPSSPPSLTPSSYPPLLISSLFMPSPPLCQPGPFQLQHPRMRDPL